MKTIKISVIIIMYNVEKYIDKCLESIINQSYTNLEIICVNNGSTDNSLNIVKKYEKEDNRIKIINYNYNNGPSYARNSGLLEATGDFVSFVDGDDLLVKNAYERIVYHIQDDIDIVWFEPKIMYENYELYKYWYKSDENWYNLKYSGRIYLTDNMFIYSDCNVWNKIFRLEKIKEANVKFPVGVIYEDAVFCYNTFLNIRKVYFLKEKLYIYNRHNNSLMDKTKNKNNKIGIDHIKILDNIYEYWSKNGFYKNKSISFQKICIKLFKDALVNVKQNEKALVFWEITKRLCKWNLQCDNNSILEQLKLGHYELKFNKSNKIIKFKGLQKIFCIKKENNGLKSVRIFKKNFLSYKCN